MWAGVQGAGRGGGGGQSSIPHTHLCPKCNICLTRLSTHPRTSGIIREARGPREAAGGDRRTLAKICTGHRLT